MPQHLLFQMALMLFALMYLVKVATVHPLLAVALAVVVVVVPTEQFLANRVMYSRLIRLAAQS